MSSTWGLLLLVYATVALATVALAFQAAEDNAIVDNHFENVISKDRGTVTNREPTGNMVLWVTELLH